MVLSFKKFVNVFFVNFGFVIIKYFILLKFMCFLMMFATLLKNFVFVFSYFIKVIFCF